MPQASPSARPRSRPIHTWSRRGDSRGAAAGDPHVEPARPITSSGSDHTRRQRVSRLGRDAWSCSTKLRSACRCDVKLWICYDEPQPELRRRAGVGHGARYHASCAPGAWPRRPRPRWHGTSSSSSIPTRKPRSMRRTRHRSRPSPRVPRRAQGSREARPSVAETGVWNTADRSRTEQGV